MKRVLVLVVALLSALLVTPAAATTTGALLPPPIPSLPTDLLVPRYVGSPATPDPLPHQPVPQNPSLAPNGRSSMHNDTYSTDAYEVSGPLGRDLQLTSRSYGVRECATITFDSRGRIEALCGDLRGFVMMLLDPETLEPISRLRMPGRNLLTGGNPLRSICGGTYFFLTPEDKAIATTTTGQLWEVSQKPGPHGPRLVRTRSWDVAEHLPEEDCLVATMPDFSGLVWFVTQQGRVGTLDRATGRVRLIDLDERIANSISIDEDGGVYVVTVEAMYRLDAGPDGRPQVTWREPYDRGSRKKPGMLSQGSGTSPTLIGDRWVVIADNAEPRMHVLVYDRRRGVTDRLHCSVPVFDAGSSATENSLVAAGSTSVIVENNYGYTGPLSTSLGQSTAPGIARVMITDDGCHVAWTNPTHAPTSVPKVSWGNGLLYVYSKPPREDLIDAWYVTAIDVRTGETVWSRLTGTGPQWNNHYAAIYLGPDGALYIATLAGLVRLQDGGA